MVKKLLIVILTSFIIFCLNSQVDKNINVVTEQWEKCTNNDGTGLYFDILREVFETEGYKLNISFYPYARAVKMIESGKGDICIGVYENELKNVIYPAYPIDADNVTAVYLKDKVKDFKGEESLKGKKVAWINDYSYDKYLSVKVDFTEINSRKIGLEMLKAGRIDFFIDVSNEVNSTLDELKFDKSLFEIKTIRYLKLYVVFINNQKGETLKKIWDKYLSRNLNTDKIKSIYLKYNFLNNYNILLKIKY